MKNIALILSILLFISSSLAAIFYLKATSLEVRLNTLSRQVEKLAVCDTNTTRELSEQKFKEDYYITQQNRDMTIVLSTFAVSLALLGFGSFKLFDVRVKQNENEINKRYEIHRRENERNEHRINNLIKEFNHELGFTILSKASICLDNKELDWYLHYVLYSISCFSECFVINKKYGNDSVCDKLTKQQLKAIAKVIENVGENTNIRNIDENLTNDYMSKARRFNSTELDRSLAVIWAKLSQ